MRALRAAGLSAALFLIPTAAFASCTPNFAIPAFDIVAKDAPVNYRSDFDSATLAKIADENGMPRVKGEVPFGLTIGRYDLEVTVNSERMRDGTGYCTKLRGAHVEIGLKQLDVLIDRRFAPGSCERQAVLDHEAEHVEIFREALRYYLPSLRRELAQVVLPPAIPVADRNKAQAAYITPITDALKPLFAAMNSRATDGNTRVDLPDSYAAVFKRCHGW